jgi:hypothetical protein
MMTVDATTLNTAPEPEVQAVMHAVRRALSAGGAIPAATETQLQNTLHSLRSVTPYSEALAALEAVAANLRVIAEAHRDGRCNLHLSQVTRLRKQLTPPEVLH